ERDMVHHIGQKRSRNGAAGILAMRLVSTTRDVSWVPGSGVYPFDPFWSFYDRAWKAARDPNYLKSAPSVRVQTNLYSVDGGKLLWTGITESFPASAARDRIETICKGIAAQMR